MSQAIAKKQAGIVYLFNRIKNGEQLSGLLKSGEFRHMEFSGYLKNSEALFGLLSKSFEINQACRFFGSKNPFLWLKFDRHVFLQYKTKSTLSKPKFKRGPKISPISRASMCCEKTLLRSSGAYERPKSPNKIGSRPFLGNCLSWNFKILTTNIFKNKIFTRFPEPIPENTRDNTMKIILGTVRYKIFPIQQNAAAADPTYRALPK